MNGPLGLEQGFTLQHAPEDESQDGLTLHLALGGILRSRVMDGGTAVELERVDGAPALRYAGLSAQDATGQTLPAWMEIVPSAQANEDEALLLHVNDRGAEYPLLIDPFFQKAQHTSSDGNVGDWFGSSVAFSEAGSTISVGAPKRYTAQPGKAYVFVWTCFISSFCYWESKNEIAALTSSNGQVGDAFGESVAISGGGNTIVVGAPGHDVGGNDSQGEAYVYMMPGFAWSGSRQETGILTASNGGVHDLFGSSVGIVGINGAGDRIIVGAPWHTVEDSRPQQGEV